MCVPVLGLSVLLDAAAAWASSREQAPLVSLQRVCGDPLAYLGRDVRLRFQVSQELGHWNPYLTRFGPADYRALSAWSDEQILWDKSTWDQPAATLFVHRGRVADLTLERTTRYARYEATAKVAQVFLGRPWIEITSVQRIGDEIGEGSILHASKALEHMGEKRWQLALENLDRAAVGEMPSAARDELRRLRQLCQQHEQP